MLLLHPSGKEDASLAEIDKSEAGGTADDHHPGIGAPTGGVSRRSFLGAGSAILASTAWSAAAAHAQKPEDQERGKQDESKADPGPENATLAGENPDSLLPPSTDHGDVPTFWYSFALAHRRVQEGGWARQQNVKDLPLAKEIAAVNMKLNAGGIRELHWHAAAEWALMLTGKARLTALDNEGKSYVNDVVAGDLWYFPTGVPHSIQGLGTDGCEFLLVFDDGTFSEFETTLVSDWCSRTPRSVLAKNLGIPESALKTMPKEELYIFQGKLPGDLQEEKRMAAGAKGMSPLSFDFKMHSMAPTHENAGGSVKIVDTSNFPVSVSMSAAYVTLKPGAMREMHWHANADEWQYYIAGKGRMTLFINSGKARTMDFNGGDVGYVPRTLGHYIENTGTTDLVFLEMFKANRYDSFSLNEWMRHTPRQLVMDHLRLDSAVIDRIPLEQNVVVPA